MWLCLQIKAICKFFIRSLRYFREGQVLVQNVASQRRKNHLLLQTGVLRALPCIVGLHDIEFIGDLNIQTFPNPARGSYRVPTNNR